MAGFLSKLIQAELHPEQGLQPRLTSRFEPSVTASGEEFEVIDVVARPPEVLRPEPPHIPVARSPQDISPPQPLEAEWERPDTAELPAMSSPAGQPNSAVSALFLGEPLVGSIPALRPEQDLLQATDHFHREPGPAVLGGPRPQRLEATGLPAHLLLPAIPGRDAEVGEHPSRSGRDLAPPQVGTAPPPPALQPAAVPQLTRDLPTPTPHPPVVNVTIGRVEVRATPPAAVRPAPAREKRRGVMTLDEYLKGRGRGE